MAGPGAFLRLLGRPELDWEGRGHPLPYERRHQLIVYLAMRRSWVGRAELAELLWPGQPPKLAHANLRKTVFRLQALPWGAALEAQGNALRFAVPTDVEAFEQALRAAPEEATRIAAPDVLAGYDDGGDEWAQWLGFERERIRSAWRTACLQRLGGDAIGAQEAVELSSRLLAADPTDEGALQLHMAWLARTGQAARAREAFAAYEARLANDFGLSPSAALKAAAEPAARPAPSQPLAARAEDAGFVGRATELRQIDESLAAGARILCIVGAGGVGKTRLALRAMHTVAARYPDGVHFVPLEDLEPGGDVVPRLARSVDLPLAGVTDPLAQLGRHLAARRALLVLDNAEHVPQAAAALAGLLRDAPGVQALVTSRVRPALADAQWLQLEGLPCPDPEDEDRLDSFDAARLFLQAARRNDPSFQASVGARSIIDICRQVDGLPLALEIAAGWTRVLSCAAIAGELRHSAELLLAADPARPARHASMEVVFAQSWALLTPSERDALARLSVFRGGFTPAAARAVAEAPFPVLAALADKSLLRKEEGRLMLHPLLQQLAAARLPAGELRDRTEAAHARYFHALMLQLQRVARLAQREALDEIDVEMENCRAAWAWAVRAREGELLARSCGALRDFFDHRGRCLEGLALLGEALAVDLPAAVQARLASVASHLNYRLDRYAEAIELAQRASAAPGAEEDPETLPQCYKVLGASHLRLGRYGEARRYFREALRVAEEAQDTRTAAGMLDNLALLEKYEGRLDEALNMSLAALARFREIGYVAGEALCLNNIGSLEGELGRTTEAIAHLKESLAVCERHELATTRAFVVANLSEQSVAAGDTAAARRYGELALEAARATGARSVEGAVYLHLAAAALAEGQAGESRQRMKSALDLALQLQWPWLMVSGALAFADYVDARHAGSAATALRLWLLTQQPLTHVQRLDLERKLQGVSGPPPAALRGLGLADLAGRIALETPTAYAALLAELGPA
jgi:predicted ATPase/DNA-binding SARP family transcriptional activator